MKKIACLVVCIIAFSSAHAATTLPPLGGLDDLFDDYGGFTDRTV